MSGKNKEEYLKENIIPQEGEALGPTAISADIAEIIISDIFEFEFGYIVPRIKMYNRSGKNNSEHGTDIIAIKTKDNDTYSTNDELLISQVKASLSKGSYEVLNKAMSDFQKN